MTLPATGFRVRVFASVDVDTLQDDSRLVKPFSIGGPADSGQKVRGQLQSCNITTRVVETVQHTIAAELLAADILC